MKKLAIVAATVVCFAGCARNDDSPTAGAEDIGSADTTAAGTAASSQSGSDLGATTPSPGLGPTAPVMTNQSSGSITDTNSRSYTNLNSLGNTNTNSINNPSQPLPPGAGGQSGIESGNNSVPPSNSQADQGNNSQSNSQSPQ